MTEFAYRPEVFVRARLDEDEQEAIAASPGPWHPNAEQDEVLAVDGETVADGFALNSQQLRATVRHIVRHDPARVLREIAAKRVILDLIQPDLDMGTQVFAPDRDGFERWGRAYLTACALAAPYKDHPDYSHKWARGQAVTALPQEETT